jgi:DNA-binding NarL/FixJ family response regulator
VVERNRDQAAEMLQGTDTLGPIRVLIADDQMLVRAGIRSLLESLSEVEVIAEARDGLEALNLVAEHEPEIVLIDFVMPNVNGLEVTQKLANLHPKVKVIILSNYSDEEHVSRALYSGALGYLFKGASKEELEVAIRSVARGEIYLSPQMSTPVIAEYLRRTSHPHPRKRLSARQRQVLELIAAGESTKKIALNLNISVKTVEAHRARLMERLDIHNVPGLVRYAIKTGLVD